MMTKALIAFILAREHIRVLRAQGQPKPWTQDRILQRFRFCNIHREDDTVTRWIASNWRDDYASNPDVWFAMVVARLFNWPPTLDHLTPVPFHPEKMVATIVELKQQRQKVYGGAYIVSTNGVAMGKVEYLMTRVLAPLWEDRKELRPRKGETLAAYHAALLPYNGLGNFLAAQVVADLKYIEPLHSAADWATWAASGPGSRRGLNRVLGHKLDAAWNEAEWLAQLTALRATVLTAIHPEPLHAQDLQNCLCEFDKYMRVKLGEGRPRATYPGGKDDS
jgi:hypothetical protein